MNVSTKEVYVWDDVAGAAFGDADQDDCVIDAFEHGAVTVQLHTSESTEMFEVEFSGTVINFKKKLKFLLMTLHTMFLIPFILKIHFLYNYQ